MSAIAQAYVQAQIQKPREVDRIIVSHFDSHGVAFAAGRLRALKLKSNWSERVIVVSKFPETGPQGLSSKSILNVLPDARVTKAIEVIDIPIDVRAPESSIETLQEIAFRKYGVPLYYFDHHETDVAWLPKLLEAGIIAIVSNNIVIASALELFIEEGTRQLALLGMVADRDRDVLKLESKQVIEEYYLPLANKLDVIVRNPQVVGLNSLQEVVEVLSERDTRWLDSVRVDYPPYEIAREVESKIVQEGAITILVDWSDVTFQLSQWIPKTLEVLLQRRAKSIVVAICRAYDPRTRQPVGFDVRVLKYWLAGEDIPTPETVVQDLIKEKAITGQVVGHADYISLRYSTLEEAKRVAEAIYRRIEGAQPHVTQLISDKYVADAVRRDFAMLLEELRKIREALERGAIAKERQIEILQELYKRDERTRYD